MKVEAIEYGDRRVFTVSAFNRGVGSLAAAAPDGLGRGRDQRAAAAGALAERLLHAQGRRRRVASSPRSCRAGSSTGCGSTFATASGCTSTGGRSCSSRAASFGLRALSIERFGLGEHLAALERLKQKLAAEGLFAPERKRPLPRIPRRIGLVTGNDAAAKRDVIAAVQATLPAGADTRRRDPRAGPSRGGRRRRGARRSLRRAGGRRRRPRARRRELRGPAAVQRRARRPRRRRLPGARRQRGRPRAGHAALRPRRGRPGLDADRGRAARRPRPRRAARVARPRAGRARPRARTGSVERHRERLASRGREAPPRRPRSSSSAAAPALDRSAAKLRALSPLATLERGYAIVRHEGAVVRDAATLAAGDEVDVRVAEGGFTGTVGEVRA